LDEIDGEEHTTTPKVFSAFELKEVGQLERAMFAIATITKINGNLKIMPIRPNSKN
tara:strand:+ start:174 stop:341 length:168 start_codon:yes stop_codon:yes gene_type:complete